jgi:hypothetical protein
MSISRWQVCHNYLSEVTAAQPEQNRFLFASIYTSLAIGLGKYKYIYISLLKEQSNNNLDLFTWFAKGAMELYDERYSTRLN